MSSIIPDGTKDEFLNDTQEVHAVWFGFLAAIGLLDLSALMADEIRSLYVELHYFCLGVVVAAVAISALFAVGIGIPAYFVFGRTVGVVMGLAVFAWVLIYWIYGCLPSIREDLVRWRAIIECIESGRDHAPGT